MAAFGYTPSDTWGLWGIKQWNEITGAGYETPEIAFEVWRKFSPVMLSDDYVVAGVGKAYNAQSLYGWYWTVDFGSYDDSQPTSLAPSPTQFP